MMALHREDVASELVLEGPLEHPQLGSNTRAGGSSWSKEPPGRKAGARLGNVKESGQTGAQGFEEGQRRDGRSLVGASGPSSHPPGAGDGAPSYLSSSVFGCQLRHKGVRKDGRAELGEKEGLTGGTGTLAPESTHASPASILVSTLWGHLPLESAGSLSRTGRQLLAPLPGRILALALFLAFLGQCLTRKAQLLGTSTPVGPAVP